MVTPQPDSAGSEEVEVWKQKRPKWCPHTDCQFRIHSQDLICGGEMPEPVPHDSDENTHRFCLAGAMDDGSVFDLQVNSTDLYHFRRIFDALDGKTSASPAPLPPSVAEVVERLKARSYPKHLNTHRSKQDTKTWEEWERLRNDALALLQQQEEEREFMLSALEASLKDEPLPNGEYPHLLICSGSRSHPPGSRGVSCCCRPKTKALRARLEEAEGVMKQIRDRGYIGHSNTKAQIVNFADEAVNLATTYLKGRTGNE